MVGWGWSWAWSWARRGAWLGDRRARRSRPGSSAWSWAGPPVPGTTTALVALLSRRPRRASDEDHNNDLARALLTHGGIWIAVGAAAGLALGIGLGGGARMARATIGGILGAVLAAVIYEFGGAIVFPVAETFRPMAIAPAPRLFAHLVVGLCVAAGALLVADHLTLRRDTHRSRVGEELS